MKEILYYDEETLNSVLSQFGQGIIKSLQFEQNEISSDSLTTVEDGKIDSGLSMSLKLSSGSLPGGEINLGGKFGGQTGVSYGSSQTLSEGQRDVIEKIFHDHALDLLLEKLHEKYSLSTNSQTLFEGDFTFVEGNYRFYDFELLTKISNPEILRNFIKMAEDTVNEGEREKIIRFGKKIEAGDVKKFTKNEADNHEEYLVKYQSILAEQAAESAFTMINTLSKFTNEVISGLILFKIGNYIVIGHKDKMRMASEALSFRADSSRRELKVLGRVIGKKDAKYDIGNLMVDFNHADFDRIPSIMLELLLNSLNISQPGDILIDPIAIYYEES